MRGLRGIAHLYFDEWWTNLGISRGDAYSFLATVIDEVPGQAHMGMMNEEQCDKVIKTFSRYPKPSKRRVGRVMEDDRYDDEQADLMSCFIDPFTGRLSDD